MGIAAYFVLLVLWLVRPFKKTVAVVKPSGYLFMLCFIYGDCKKQALPLEKPIKLLITLHAFTTSIVAH